MPGRLARQRQLLHPLRAQLRASWHHQRFRRTARAAFDAELAKVEAEHTALRRELAAAYAELDRLRSSPAPQPAH